MGKYLPSIDYIGKVPCLNVFYPFFRRKIHLIHCHNIFIIIIFDGFQGKIFASDYLFVDKHINESKRIVRGKKYSLTRYRNLFSVLLLKSPYGADKKN